MTQQTRATFISTVDSTLTDGGENTAAEVRTILGNDIDSCFVILTDDSDSITEGATNLFLTTAERTILGNTSGTNTGDQTSVTGNAATATALQTARTINGTSFDGTANITITAEPSDGDKGDITVSASGATWNIDAGAVSTTELGGDITTAGKALLDDVDASAQRTTLGLGTAATTAATDYATAAQGALADTALQPGDGTTITLGTPVASTSGTSVDFTGIPAGTKRITINFTGVSTSGTSNHLILIGDSGGVEVSGYAGSVSILGSSSIATSSYTIGFGVTLASTAAGLVSGRCALELLDASANIWTSSGALATTGTVTYLSAGSKTLTAALDRVRITTVNGTDTFDAGSINIAYE